MTAWVEFDRAAALAERCELEAPADRRRQVRDEFTRTSASAATIRERWTFTQDYGSKELDSSVLNIPLVGFLPGSDERVTGTIDAISRELAAEEAARRG